MYYLLCFLLLVGGGPKHKVSGHFYFSPDESRSRPISARLCQDGKCSALRLDEHNSFYLKLREGTYEVRFTNQWHQQVTETFVVESDLSVTFDGQSFLPRDSYPVWEAFQELRSLSIAERSGRGERTWERQMIIKAHKGGITVALDDPAGDVQAQKMLSPLEASQLEDFLRKVDLYDKSEGCEEAVLYLMQAGEETFIIEDGSCGLWQLESILHDMYVGSYVSQEFP